MCSFDADGTSSPRHTRNPHAREAVGLEVELLVDADDVRILNRGAEVAPHRLGPPGGASIQDDH